MASVRRRSKKEKSKLHWLRDGDAGAHYVAKITAAGYDYRQEFNAPPPPGCEHEKAERGAAALERLKKGDVILLNNRPPLTPDRNRLLAPITRSGSWLEDQVLGALGRVFAVCSRDEVVLNSEIAAMLSAGYATRAKVKFQTRPGAEYSHCAGPGENYREIDSECTAGYLVYTREIWPNGPDLLCSFAMSGPMNLVWSYLVTTRFPGHVVPGERERVLVADIEPRPLGHGRELFPHWPETLEFAQMWCVTPALDRHAPRLWP